MNNDIDKEQLLITKHIKNYLNNNNIEVLINIIGYHNSEDSTFLVSVYYKDLDDEEEKYIVKICKTQYKNIKNVSIETYSIGIAPKVLYYDNEDKIIIYEFINVLSTKGISHIIRLKSLINNIKLYHSIKYNTNITHTFENIKNPILYDPILYKNIHQHYYIALDIINILNPYLINKYGVVFSHNDLHDGNRLWNGNKYLIIDYEISYYNSPFIDLGYQTLYFINKEEEILKEYFGVENVKEELKNDFIIGKCLSFLFTGLTVRTVNVLIKKLIKNEITHNFKELTTITTTPYNKLYNINCFDNNQNYFISSLLIKESFVIIKNNIELFKPLLDEELLNNIFILL
jgi:thiamine kinase-like enzyme